MATILIIEEDTLFRWSLKDLLQNTGRAVLEAENGAEGRARHSRKVDLVILNFQLPDIPGGILIAELKRIQRRSPIVALTAYPTDREEEEARSNGADHYLEKTPQFEPILELISFILDETRLTRLQLS